MAITDLVVTDIATFADGHEFGAAGAYVRIKGVARGTLDPAAPANAGIVDLDKAPRNADGLVGYAVDFDILRPKDPLLGNSILVYDVPNRGAKRIFNLLGRSAAKLTWQQQPEDGRGRRLRFPPRPAAIDRPGPLLGPRAPKTGEQPTPAPISRRRSKTGGISTQRASATNSTSARARRRRPLAPFSLLPCRLDRPAGGAAVRAQPRERGLHRNPARQLGISSTTARSGYCPRAASEPIRIAIRN